MQKQLNDKRDALLSSIQESYLAVKKKVRALVSSKPETASSHSDAQISQAILDVRNLAERARDRFSKLTDQAFKQLTDYRLFRHLHGDIPRPAYMPKVENTSALLFAWGFLEACMVAVVYGLGGDMSIIEGFGYGAIFSFCNITIGGCMGWAYRYTLLTYHDRGPKRLKSIHRNAWLVIGAMALLLCVLILTGARLRSLERNTDIWNFTDLSFWATFSDGYTIIFFAIATLSGLIAAYKGATAFSDIIVGYTPMQKQVSKLDEVGEDLAEDLEESIEEICENAIDDYEAAQGDADDIHSYREACDEILEQCEKHNQLVRETEIQLKDLFQSVVHINGRNPAFPTDQSHLLIDIEAVEKMLELPPAPQKTADLVSKLEQERLLAIAVIKESLMAYLGTDKTP